MTIDTEIAALARYANRMIREYAMLEQQRILNTWITEDGKIMNPRPPADIERQCEEAKDKLNKALYELDQLIEER